MAGQKALDLRMWVRPLLPEPRLLSIVVVRLACTQVASVRLGQEALDNRFQMW